MASAAPTDNASLGARAREAIEAEGVSVAEMRTAYIEQWGQRYYATTVCNADVKEEGCAPEGEVDSEAELEAVLPKFIRRCLSLRKRKDDTLIWRRKPAVDEWNRRYRISARLVWVPANG